MKILIASDDFNELFSRDITGRIHSVFNKAMNLNIGGQLFTIGTKGVLIGPRTAILSEEVSFIDLGLIKETIFEKNGNIISFKCNHFKIEYEPTQIWMTGIKKIKKRDTLIHIEEKLKSTMSWIFEKGDESGISPIVFYLKDEFQWIKMYEFQKKDFSNKNMKFIIPRITELIKSLTLNNNDDFISGVIKTVGFGPGLTPASDDFLVGLMAGIRYSNIYFNESNEEFAAMAEMAMKKVIARTTDISYIALEEASRGNFNFAVEDVAIAILEICKGNEFESKVEQLLKIGQTSGTDILTGMVVAMMFKFN
ncbi:MAG: DUF2877 domain-containing protein [Clostridiales bacterium]|nr:DUF2877 domain-containing protein [Clostridiales bacterium]